MTSPDDQEVNIVNLFGLNNKFVMKLNGKPIDILRVVDLKEELAKRDLPKHGKKQDLVQRLTNYLQQNPHECDAEGPDMGGGGGSSAPIAATVQQGQVIRSRQHEFSWKVPDIEIYFPGGF